MPIGSRGAVGVETSHSHAVPPVLAAASCVPSGLKTTV